MSPVIFYSAFAIGFAGKFAFPKSIVPVVLVATAAFPLAAAIYFADVSLLAFLLVTPITLTGAIIGVLMALVVRDFWRTWRSRT